MYRNIRHIIVVGFVIVIIGACSPMTMTQESTQAMTATVVPPTQIKPYDTPTATVTPEPKPSATPEFRDAGGQYTPEQMKAIGSSDTLSLNVTIKSWFEAWVASGLNNSADIAYVQVKYIFDDPDNPEIALPVLDIFDVNNKYLMTITPPKGDYIREVPVIEPGKLALGEDEGPMQISAPEGQLLTIRSVSFEKAKNYFVKKYVIQRREMMSGKVLQEINEDGNWVDIKERQVVDKWNIVPGGISTNQKELLDGDIMLNQEAGRKEYEQIINGLIKKNLEFAEKYPDFGNIFIKNGLSDGDMESLWNKIRNGEEIKYGIPIGYGAQNGSEVSSYVLMEEVTSRLDTIMGSVRTKDQLLSSGYDVSKVGQGANRFFDIGAGVGSRGYNGNVLSMFEVIENLGNRYLKLTVTCFSGKVYTGDSAKYFKTLYDGISPEEKAKFATLAFREVSSVLNGQMHWNPSSKDTERTFSLAVGTGTSMNNYKTIENAINKNPVFSSSQ